MEKPLYTALKDVFDSGVLYPGRAVRLSGFEETGEPRAGVFLVNKCDYERLMLVDHRGNMTVVYIDDVLQEDPYARTTITLLEG
ncbi:hypothetical protein IJ21_17630 [Paenibacillus sp. 32O-W]|uniref:hypothetical protein n=1 Tax=Paenibacillus sp. 32O-W TaxID=1695218 RepID=UPI0007221DEF|nr:hypothetical protein [Paenibacillus sp. 32O-W]ALS27164.1 hypothetical protein IJ21_17630 [Paenibacillus sp. 32O-W]